MKEDFIFTVEDTDMEPLFLKGDKAYIKKINFENIKPGEFVLILISPEFPKYIIRRIAKRKIRGGVSFFAVKKDKSLYADMEFSLDQIIGKVIKLTDSKGREKNIKRDAVRWRKKHIVLVVIKYIKNVLVTELFYNLVWLIKKINSISKTKEQKIEGQIIYREANIKDVDSIAKLMYCYHWPISFKYLKQMYENEIRDNIDYFLVAQRDSEIVGIRFHRKIGISPTGYTVFFPGFIYVHWKFRNCGIGHRLETFMWKNKLQGISKILFLAWGFTGTEKVIWSIHLEPNLLKTLHLPAITERITLRVEFSPIRKRKLIDIAIWMINRDKPKNLLPKIEVIEDGDCKVEKRIKELFLGRQ
jgi:N-acetylglutamate synthase-like GNAT family acetyltransferase